MKKITTLFSALVLTAFGWQANAQYCAAGPTNTFDTNLDTIYLAGDAGSALDFLACPGVTGVQNLTASQTVNVTAGANYTADILFGTCGGNYGAVGEAWIDWNQNFTFEASESIGTWTGVPPTTNTPMAFTVPAGAANGNTVLRVMQEESGALPLDPCGTFTYGSVTDFTINVSGGVTICNTPSFLSANNITTTTADLGWMENGTATLWDIEWDAAGFTPGTGTMVTGTATNPHALTGLTSNTSYDFYVRADCGGGDTSSWSGPFNFVTSISCPVPSNLAAIPTLTSADLSWTENGTGTLWEVEYDVAGFTLGTGNTTNTSANPHTLPGLTASTSYQFYVRTICGAADSSTWAGPFSFSTPCIVNSTFPYTENFDALTPNDAGIFACITTDNLTECWNNDGANTNMWTARSTPTGSTATGPSADNTSGAGNYIFLETSSCFNNTSHVYSESMDFTSLTAPRMTFYYHMYGAAMGSLDAYASTDGGATWSASLWTLSGDQGNTWMQAIVDLSAYTANADVIIRFTGVSGADFTSDMAIDDVTFEETPSCIAPTALTATNINTTSADLGWMENGTATLWDIEWDVAGFTPGTGTVVTGTATNPHSLTGLTAATAYEFYVRADCGGGDTSVWIGPFFFETTPDYCAGDHFYDNGGASGDYLSSSADTTIICPDTPGDIITATFNLFDTESGYDSLHVYDGVGTSGTFFGGYSGTTIPGPFFSADPSGCLTFVFSSDGSVVNPGWDATITCGPAPSCPQPSMLAANVAGVSVDLSWMENGAATLWEVEYDTAGFTPGTGNATNTATNPHNLSGLAASTSYDFYVRAICGAADSSVWVGPFNFVTGITCPAPSNLAAAVTTTTADLSWLENGVATLWEVEYDTAGFTPGTGNATNTSTNPHNIVGLTASTNYNFYVRAICGAGDTSLWTGPFNFATTCIPPVISSYPYSENFDAETAPAIPCGWTIANDNADANQWETNTLNPNSGANALYVNYNAGMAANDWIFTPELQLISGTAYDITFAYRARTATYVESLSMAIGMNRDSVSMNTILFDSINFNHIVYDTVTVNYVATSTGAFYVGFFSYSSANQWGIHIDDFSIDVGTITAVSTIENNVALNVYPNPNKGVFTLNVNTTDVKELNIKVINAQGQAVYAKNNFDNINNVNEQIDLSNNAKGIYFINVTTDKGVKTHKVVVQ